MRALRAGSEAVLIEVAGLDAALALHDALREDPPEGVTEIVAAARTALLRFAPETTTAERLATEVAHRDLTARRALPGEVVEIPVVYDGEDLDDVARLCGLSRAEVVARHASAEHTVAFTGFAPGFAYLAGGDPALRVPRLETPRTAVPAGSVAVADEFSGVYPRSSPGGWRLLGRTDAVLFDAGREPPALLRPGTRVRFRPVDALRRRSREPSGTGRPGLGRPAAPALEVVTPGGQTLVQDLGRPGRADLGVGASGAMDRTALRRANRLVGNPAGSAALEVALGGLTLRADGDLVVALSGAPAPVEVDGRAQPHDRPFLVRDGETLALGLAARGVYAYVAVRGGLEVPEVLGSASRDVLAGLGPEPLAAGDRLGAGRAPAGAVRPAESGPELPAAGETTVLDVLPGPRQDWFTTGALETVTSQGWAVTERSNRVGARLDGGTALERSRTDELPSEGGVRGALQVPPDGQPVLFAADHPVTGGYPVIACLVAAHLALAAQLPPGAEVRFRLAGGR